MIRACLSYEYLLDPTGSFPLVLRPGVFRERAHPCLVVVAPSGGSACWRILTRPDVLQHPPAACIHGLLAQHTRQIRGESTIACRADSTLRSRVLVLLERAEPRPVVMQWFTMGGGLLNAGMGARARVHHQPRPLLPSSASGRLHGMLA